MNESYNPDERLDPNSRDKPTEELGSRLGRQAAAEECVLDVLLAEALGGIAPPDLREPILLQLSKSSEAATASGQPLSSADSSDEPGTSESMPRRGRSSDVVLAGDESGKEVVQVPVRPREQIRCGADTSVTSRVRRQLAWAVSLVAAVAATGLLIAAWRSSDEGASGVAPIADGGGDSAPRPDGLVAEIDGFIAEIAAIPEEVVPAPDDRSNLEIVPEAPRPPRRGIPLVVAEAEVGEESPVPLADDPPSDPPRPIRSQPVQLVSRAVDADFRSYWNSVGVTPSTTKEAEEVSERMRERLDVILPVAAIGDVELIRHIIAEDGNATKIATRWLGQVTEGGIARLEEKQRQRLIGEFALSLQGQRRFDETLSGWLGGEGEAASDWYSAVSVGGQNAMARRLASVTMGVDLRCTRCHDSFVEGSGRQQDYWSFAALLRRDLRRQEGTYVVRDGSEGGADVFYDLPDGRQRLADAGIPERWLPSADSSPTTLRQWATSLKGREELARGVVNSLWALVHGRPLHGSVIDTITAPHDVALTSLERRLIEDLLDSGFDVGRTLALVIDSPATSRSVPTELQGDSLFAAAATSRQAVGAFAIAAPKISPLSANERLNVALRSVGGKLDSLPDGQKLLAQLGEAGTAARSNSSARTGNELPADYPTRVASLPVDWLASLKDPESQWEHLGYLAGRSDLPESVRETAELMRKAGVSEELLLHRVWWLLQR